MEDISRSLHEDLSLESRNENIGGHMNFLSEEFDWSHSVLRREISIQKRRHTG
jgi:hypothetical protein